MQTDPTSHTLSFTYDRPLVRRALRRFMTKRLGLFSRMFPALIIAWLAWDVLNDSWTDTDTFLAGFLGVIVVVALSVYMGRMRAAVGFLDQSMDPMVSLTFTEAGICTQAEIGSSNLKWSMFEELLKFRDVWLLVYDGSGFMTVPTAQMSPACAEFIERCFKARDTTAD